MDAGDISGLTAGAAAYQLYQKPGLLRGVAESGGDTRPGSERVAAKDEEAAASEKAGAAKAKAKKFEPFDKKPWWEPAQKAADTKQTEQTHVDDTAKATKKAADTAAAAPKPKYAFNPFDQASWWTPTKGTKVDTAV